MWQLGTAGGRAGRDGAMPLTGLMRCGAVWRLLHSSGNVRAPGCGRAANPGAITRHAGSLRRDLTDYAHEFEIIDSFRLADRRSGASSDQDIQARPGRYGPHYVRAARRRAQRTRFGRGQLQRLEPAHPSAAATGEPDPERGGHRPTPAARCISGTWARAACGSTTRPSPFSTDGTPSSRSERPELPPRPGLGQVHPDDRVEVLVRGQAQPGRPVSADPGGPVCHDAGHVGSGSSRSAR